MYRVRLSGITTNKSTCVARPACACTHIYINTILIGMCGRACLAASVSSIVHRLQVVTSAIAAVGHSLATDTPSDGSRSTFGPLILPISGRNLCNRCVGELCWQVSLPFCCTKDSYLPGRLDDIAYACDRRSKWQVSFLNCCSYRRGMYTSTRSVSRYTHYTLQAYGTGPRRSFNGCLHLMLSVLIKCCMFISRS